MRLGNKCALECHFHRTDGTVFLEIESVYAGYPVVAVFCSQRVTVIYDIPLIPSLSLDDRMVAGSCSYLRI